MKHWITCKKCGQEVKVECGGGKKGEQYYEYIKDDYVCDDCKQAAKEAKIAADYESKKNNGWTEITVHYSVYKNEYEGKCNSEGKKVKKGEYHNDTKEIDILVPSGNLAQLTDDEIWIITEGFRNVLKGETEEEFESRKAAILAKFD